MQKGIGWLWIASCLLGSVLLSAKEYEVIGRHRAKTYNDLASKIAAELFEESTKTEKLFESMNIEFDIDFFDIVEGRLRYSRSVDIDNPEVKGDFIGPYDYAQYRVTNTIYTGLDADVNSGALSSDASGGVFFGVSKKVMPRSSTLPGKLKSDMSLQEICEMTKEAYNPILARNDDTKLFAAYDCIKEKPRKDRNGKIVDDRSFSEKHIQWRDWLEGFVKTLNKPVKNIMQDYVADSEKMKIYSDSPFEALTNYSRYGLPVDLGIFYDSNKLLGVGDSVQQSIFYGWSPFNLQGDLSWFTAKLNLWEQTRAVRDIRIRKEGGNSVTLQVTDYLSKGRDWQYARLRPRFLWLFKYTLADWRSQNFDVATFRRVYKIDLASNHMYQGREYSGLDFLKIIIVRGWLDKLELDPQELLKPEDLPPSVDNKSRVYVSGPVAHDKFLLRFPGVFEMKDEDRMRVKVARINTDKAQAEAERSHYSKRKWRAFSTWFFDKTDRSTYCSLNTKTYASPQMLLSSNGLLSDKIALNLDCKHSEAYPEEDWPMRAYDTAMILNDLKVDSGFREALSEVEAKKVGRLSFVNNVSLNWQHIDHLLGRLKNKDDVVLELAEIFLGKEYRELWERDGVRRVKHHFDVWYKQQGRNDFILEKYAPLYCSTTAGLASPKLGFEDFWITISDAANLDGQTCHSLVRKIIFPLASNLHEISQIEAKDYDDPFKYISEKLEAVMKTYARQDITFPIAILLQRFSETQDNPIHNTYAVDSEQFLSPITFSSGEPYRVVHEDLTDEVSDALEFVDQNVRIRNALLLKDRGVRGAPSNLRLDLFSSHKFPPGSTLEVEVRRYIYVLKDEYLSTERIDLQKKAVIPISEYRSPIPHFKSLGTTMNGAKFAYQDINISVPGYGYGWKKDAVHIMHLRVKDPNGEWLSEETPIQFKYKY